MKNWQIISRLGLTLDFQKAVTASEALRKYAVKCGFVDYKTMCYRYCLSDKWEANSETSKIKVP